MKRLCNSFLFNVLTPLLMSDAKDRNVEQSGWIRKCAGQSRPGCDIIASRVAAWHGAAPGGQCRPREGNMKETAALLKSGELTLHGKVIKYT